MSRSRRPHRISPRANSPIWQPHPQTAAALIVFAGIICYANSLHGPMIFDDRHAIIENPSIRRIWPLSAALSPPGGGTTVQGRPLVNLSLALNFACGGSDGLQVEGYHTFNIAVHLLAALVLFDLVRRTLLLPHFSGSVGSAATSIAFASALLWTIHPLATESVNYLIQRTESMMALAYLSTLYLVLRGATSSHSGSFYRGAVIACAAGMASKEVMVSAPVMALLYDRIFLSPSWRDCFQNRGRLYCGLFATWGLLAALVLSSGSRGNTAGWQVGISPWDYACLQFGYILHYLRLCFLPYPLVIDYGHAPLEVASSLSIAIHAVLVILLAAGTLASFRFRPWIGFLGALYFMVLAPTSSILPIVTEVAAERRAYLPLAAVIVFTVATTFHAGLRICTSTSADTERCRRFAITGWCALMIVACVLGSGVILRNYDYQSDSSIWLDAVHKLPSNPRAHYSLGVALLREGDSIASKARLQLQRGDIPTYEQLQKAAMERYVAAIPAYLEAIRKNYELAETWTDLGITRMRLEEYDQASECYRQALLCDPKSVRALTASGALHQGRGDYERARELFLSALQIVPEYLEAKKNLGTVEYNLGVRAVERRALEEARSRFEAAIAARPDFAEAHFNLGVVLEAQGHPQEARRHWQRTIEIQPDSPKAKAKLAAAPK